MADVNSLYHNTYLTPPDTHVLLHFLFFPLHEQQNNHSSSLGNT